MNTFIETMNKKNKDTTKALHKAFGIDFQNEFFTAEIPSKFTVNQLRKIAQENGYNPSNSILLMILDDPFWGNAYTVAEITTAGFTVDITRAWAYNTLYAKCDFEDKRKKGRFNGGYLLAQKRENLSGDIATHNYVSEDKGLQITSEGRYKIEKVSHGWIYLVDHFDGDAKNHYSGGYNNRVTEENIHEYIDKSGYCIDEVRDELDRRLRKYKAEQAKKRYLAQDYTAKIAALKKLIDAKKEMLLVELSEAKTADQMKALSNKLSYSGMYGIFEQYERMTERNAAKKYASPEDFERSYKWIVDDLAKV